MSLSISFDRKGTKVFAIVRQWDGIDRPDLTHIEMSADEAMGHAGQLQILGSAAREELGRLKAEQIENKRQKIASLRDEIATIERELSLSPTKDRAGQ